MEEKKSVQYVNLLTSKKLFFLFEKKNKRKKSEQADSNHRPKDNFIEPSTVFRSTIWAMLGFLIFVFVFLFVV